MGYLTTSIRSKRLHEWRVVLIVRNAMSREEDNMDNKRKRKMKCSPCGMTRAF